MKAVVFKEVGAPLVYEDVPDPHPAPDQVVIKVCRCGICGSDLHISRSPLFGVPSGTILGHEYAGEVVEVGSACERIKVGDRVAVLPIYGCGHCAYCQLGEPAWCKETFVSGGGYSQYSLTSERQCVKLPETLSTEDGALVEPLAVGLHGVAVGGLPPGSRVLVLGAGPIGLTTIFWAQRLGAARIAVVARSNRAHNMAIQMGADNFLVDNDAVKAQVADALSGAPDIVYECVGAHGMTAKAFDHVRQRGKVVTQGLNTSADPFVPFVPVTKEACLQGSALYTMKEFEYAAAILARDPAALRFMVTQTVSLADMPETFEALHHRTTQCKVLVQPN